MVQQINDYKRIASAIEYIKTNFKRQPDLDEVAEQVHLSPFHFQRIFTEWAGVSPKKFLQYLSIEYAKGMLTKQGAKLSDVAMETGLSGTSRLHDLFIKIEGMTPGEFKNGGEGLNINYSFAQTPFGHIIVASTAKGICHLSFAEEEAPAVIQLKSNFPKADWVQKIDMNQKNALMIFEQDWSKIPLIKLHLKGSPFQIKVWEALLKIPTGRLTTYSTIAHQIQSPKANRAVGSAIGDNPVAVLIPCHRVIRSTGELGQYHWGITRKQALIGWEAAQSTLEHHV